MSINRTGTSPIPPTSGISANGDKPGHVGRGACLTLALPAARRMLAAVVTALVVAGGLPADPLHAEPAPLGTAGFVYIDPEFEPGGTRMVFQDQAGVAWVGEIDPETAQCVSATCRDLQVASDVLVPGDMRYRFNGPEWGISASGTSLYVSIYDEQGIPQTWRVKPDGTDATQLSFDPDGAWGGLVSVAPAAGSVRILAGTGDSIDGINAVWFDENEGELNPLEAYSTAGQGGQFFPGSSRLLTYGYKTVANVTQIAVLDTDNEWLRLVTETPGSKSQMWAFSWDGILHIMSVKNLTEIEIYRSGSRPWQKVASLIPPTAGFMYSTEPLGNTGCFVTSLQDGPDPLNYSDSAIYVACLDGSWKRVDDATPMTRRSEPEPWRTGRQAREWRIFYNVNDIRVWASDPFLTR